MDARRLAFSHPVSPRHTLHILVPSHTPLHTPTSLHTPFTRRASPMATLRKPLLRIEQDLPPGEYALAACWKCWLRVGGAPARWPGRLERKASGLG